MIRGRGRERGLALMLLALGASEGLADAPQAPPAELVVFISATQAAAALVRECPEIDWDQQGYIWASERMWRIMDAEGLSRVHFRDQIRPLSAVELTSEIKAFRARHGLGVTASPCDAAAAEAPRDTALGQLIVHRP